MLIYFFNIKGNLIIIKKNSFFLIKLDFTPPYNIKIFYPLYNIKLLPMVWMLPSFPDNIGSISFQKFDESNCLGKQVKIL